MIRIILERWSALFILGQTQTPGGVAIISIEKGIIIRGRRRVYGNHNMMDAPPIHYLQYVITGMDPVGLFIIRVPL